VTKVDCLRAEHVVGNDLYPIFIGFMTAAELSKYAEAPQFGLSTDHEVIAGNITSTPVREWQRPVDDERVEEIARIFGSSTEIMPNAVLLAAPDPSKIKLSGHGGKAWQLELAKSAGKKPLWILDGQHRIAGLAASQSDSEIPFVLLASHGTSSNYQDSTFAKIFAQVTTTAEGLHPLHDGWLTFAFRLGKYDPTSPAGALKNSQHVVSLCHERHLDTAKTQANPFFNRIAFNPGSFKRTSPSPSIGPIGGGFNIDANEFQTIAFKSYYSKSLPAGKLPPDELAVEIGRAYEALVASHKPAQRADSVLLNSAGTTGAKGHKALQEGILHGFFRYVAQFGAPTDWLDVMKQRAVDTTDWRASSWSSASRTGTQGTTNRKLAKAVFDALFSKDLGALFLPGSHIPAKFDLRKYFGGDIGWGVEIQGRRMGPKGNKVAFSGSQDPHTRLESGVVLANLDVGALRMVASGKATPSVVAVTVADIGRPFEKNWTFQSIKAGTELDTKSHLHSNPIRLRFDLTFYGGLSRYVELEIDWT
jgi:DGQHR domain-containing protein